MMHIRHRLEVGEWQVGLLMELDPLGPALDSQASRRGSKSLDCTMRCRSRISRWVGPPSTDYSVVVTMLNTLPEHLFPSRDPRTRPNHPCKLAIRLIISISPDPEDGAQWEAPRSVVRCTPIAWSGMIACSELSLCSVFVLLIAVSARSLLRSNANVRSAPRST